MLYFAYGSNMWRQQMAERCPGHELIGTAVLKDHTLCFPRFSKIRKCGVAGIRPQPGAEVWGVVYRLTAQDFAALDRREGYDPLQPPHVNRYDRRSVRVLRDGESLDCLTYFAREEPGRHVPNAAYMQAILTGAEENGLPREYVTQLRTIIPQ
ncbi:MAG: gamma-glutamylcyclotransferase [Aestuariivirga sp.]|nr:gamma-glutamylcyclotransferase [Aestuariivirga sp.]